jgi:hypothetical protein
LTAIGPGKTVFQAVLRTWQSARLQLPSQKKKDGPLAAVILAQPISI